MILSTSSTVHVQYLVCFSCFIHVNGCTWPNSRNKGAELKHILEKKGISFDKMLVGLSGGTCENFIGVYLWYCTQPVEKCTAYTCSIFEGISIGGVVRRSVRDRTTPSQKFFHWAVVNRLQPLGV